MTTKLAIYSLVIAAMAVSAIEAQSSSPSASSNTIAVTADNFTRAETDTYFANIVKQAGGPGKFLHRRELEPIDKQIVIRGNRDTLYSAAVFDLDAGPVTITVPDAGKRFMSLIVIDEDQYTPAVYYGAGSHTFTKEQIGTRYLMLALRIFVDLNDPEDLKKAHALQDAVKLDQHSHGSFVVPNWDQVSHKKLRDALLVLASTLPDSDRGFGTKAQVDPVRRLILSASAWGGNPDSEDAYSLNTLTAKKSADGSVAVQFGGCDGKIPNCLPTVPGWNYMVRFYRPRKEILDGTWKFPEAQPQ